MATFESDELAVTPLFKTETAAVIRARWRDWANEGLDPAEDVDLWTDTREGSHWFAQTAMPIDEFVRLYDKAGTETIAAALPQYSFGEYLDDHAELRQVGRLTATVAAGTVVFRGTPGKVISAGAVVGVEPEDPDAAAPQFVTRETVTIAESGEVEALASATEPGIASNVASDAIQALITPVEGVESLTNPLPFVGGTETESDSALKGRVLESFSGVAVANQAYYRRIALQQPGVGRATVISNPEGPGTIEIIIATANGGPVSPEIVTSFQALIDPTPGKGAGLGQVGATISVTTAEVLEVPFAAQVDPEVGYSLDGAAGTAPLRAAIVAAVAAYVRTIPPGGEIVLARVLARIIGVTGVHDVDGVTIDGVAENFAIPASPPRTATVGAATLTEVS